MISYINTLHNQMLLFSSENQSYIDNLGLKVLLSALLAGPPSLPGPAIIFWMEKCARWEGAGMLLSKAHPVGMWGVLRADGVPCADMGVKNPGSQTQALQHWVGAELLSAVKAELHHGMLWSSTLGVCERIK